MKKISLLAISAIVSFSAFAQSKYSNTEAFAPFFTLRQEMNTGVLLANRVLNTGKTGRTITSLVNWIQQTIPLQQR